MKKGNQTTAVDRNFFTEPVNEFYNLKKLSSRIKVGSIIEYQ